MIRHFAITFLILSSTLAANAQQKTDQLVQKTLKCKALSEQSCPAFTQLLKMKETAVPQLLLALKSEIQPQRSHAARIISRDEFGPAERRTRLLVDALKSTEPSIAGETIEALGRIGHTAAIKPLTALVQSKSSPRNKIYLINALGSYRGENIRKTLIPFLNADQPRVQLAAVANLGRMDDPQVVAPIIQRTMAPLTAGYVREEGARVLTLSGDPRVHGPLTLLLANSNHRVRQAAARALGALKVKSSVPALLVQLKDPQTIGPAADALGQIGDKRATAALVTLATDAQSSIKLRKKALWSLGLVADNSAEKSIFTILDGENAELAVAAAEALGRAGHSTAIDELIKRLADKRSLVRRACAWALEKITKQQMGLDQQAWLEWRSRK